jgi:two-component sensor histidine kinase
LVDISLTVSPIMTAEGHIIGASKIARDITERKRAHERQLFLIRELEHRTKNFFAVFHAIVNRSLVEPHTLAEAKAILSGRLQALAQAHAMLADAAWRGAPLTDIIRKQLAGFAENNLSISGCDLNVNTPAAQHFALAVHELATNATKYGALSVPHGHVSIKCNVERSNGHSTFSFMWKESGGPPVVPPTHNGFGSSFLLNSAKQFGPHVALNYEPDGLRYEVRFPLRAIEASTEMTAKRHHKS